MFNRREAGGRGGLGLAISQAFVEAHGERIWVEDVGDGPGASGARFVFTLPVLQDGHRTG
jgi:signal transduction histidine kinase